MGKSQILDHDQIMLKLDRLAWQIAEGHYGVKEIYILGIRDRGSKIAELIGKKLSDISKSKVILSHLSIDKDRALSATITWTNKVELKNKAVVIVDDVLNSGLTLSAVFKEVLAQEPASIKVAVLANRDHKSFPISADFVGISIATTLKDHISLAEEKGKMAVYLV